MRAGLARHPSAEWERGQVVGLGLTLRPTPHRFTFVGDLRAGICRVGRFFASREAAAGWLAQRPQGQVTSVAEGFEIHREVTTELGWIAR